MQGGSRARCARGAQLRQKKKKYGAASPNNATEEVGYLVKSDAPSAKKKGWKPAPPHVFFPHLFAVVLILADFSQCLPWYTLRHP
jgi:hypothetical protein